MKRILSILVSLISLVTGHWSLVTSAIAASPTYDTMTATTVTATTTLNAPASFTLPFAKLTTTPTTLSGYGITNGQPLDADLTSIAALATTSFGRSFLTVADAVAGRTLIGAGTSSFDGAFSSLTGKPTTLAGYGITDAQPLDSDLTSIAALSTTSFGRSFLTLADAAAGRTLIGAGTSSFDGAFSSLTGKPTTLSVYGITDAQPLDADLTSIAALATTSFGRSFLTVADAAAGRTLIGAGTSSFDGAFSSLTGKPTTLSGYGITDAEVPLTFSTGLTRSTNTITVNTTQNLAKLSNLTSNGFVKTGGGDGTLSIDTATYLTGNQTITLAGDLTGSGTTAITGTLATVNGNVGSFGSATKTTTFAVNAKGLVTAASEQTATPAVGSITGLGTGVATALAVNTGSAGAPVLFNGAGGTPSSLTLTNASGTAASLTAGTATALATGRTLAITGDLAYTSPSFDGTGNVTAAGTLATVNGNVGSFGSVTKTTTFTVNAKGLVTAASEQTATPAVGSITGLGTGVATALAVNTGSAGAPVLFNGAGGTPSSLTLTNASGTAASLTAGTVTTNANLTGDVTSSGNATTLAAGSASNLNSGTLAAARMPALTGDVTTSAGAVATTAKTALKTGAIGITIDGGGSALTTGVKGYISVPYDCTISSVTCLADQSGSAVVDVWKDTYANYPPTVADTITASAKPTITTATKSTDSTLTGWTTSVTAGDVIGFNVDSATTITRLHVILKVTK